MSILPGERHEPKVPRLCSRGKRWLTALYVSLLGIQPEALI